MRQEDPNYEQLANSQFQSLVSSLIVREHPRVQCMPLSGRDGGRDAIVQMATEEGKLADSVVFQVKMHERSVLGTPTTDQLFSWMRENIHRERRKVKALASRGVREYILVTNIPASGDLATGLRDRVKSLLDREYPIPSSVWWREDINTRLRAYPEVAAAHGLITGQDALRGICRTCFDAESSTSSATIHSAQLDIAVAAISAYCSEQYKEDRVMRFSQVDLDPVGLLDLFIDVPLGLSEDQSGDYRRRASIARLLYFQRQAAEKSRPRQHEMYRRDDFDGPRIGAADFLLLDDSNLSSRVLIEGAPGQGKSTVSQYTCQVHRARILDKEEDLERLDTLHRHSRLRIPFRVELRRYASWLLEDPNRSDTGILAFITTKVQKAAELAFDSSHLIAVLCGTPGLMILDGLDEVADVETRSIVIDKIVRLSDNLKAWRANVKVIVTSRPSTLTQGKSLPEDAEFSHFTLSNLPKSLILEYADIWISYKKLVPQKSREIKEVLEQSLSSRHVADLARNPMQLAILLYLIFTQGKSLPEKRTALYDSYIRTFQTRESDKSLPVSQYGDLLLNIHGYIAWLLHCRSELGRPDGAQGDISTIELTTIVAEYLEFEGYERELAHQVLSGVQRFFVLVERVEGRFEFEVQPLREFFAARHLYTTSPLTPTVAEPAGTRPERLDALLKNPHWLNVLRFFVGNYHKGELADLARRLVDLLDIPIWGRTARAYEILYRLLVDYSMYQSRRDTRDVAKTLAAGLGARLIRTEFSSVSVERQRTSIFTDDTGRKEIVQTTRSILESDPAYEVTAELARTLANNDPEVGEWWWQRWIENGDSLTAQRSHSRVGSICKVFHDMPIDRASRIFMPENPARNEIWIRCIEAGRSDVAELDELRANCAIQELANGCMTIAAITYVDNWLGTLALLTTKGLLEGYRFPRGYTGHQLRASSGRHEWKHHPVPDNVAPFQSLAESLSKIAMNDHWSPRWKAVSAAVSDAFGESWTSWRTAFSPIGDFSARGNIKECSFLDSDASHIERVRAAALHRTDSAYWAELINAGQLREPGGHGLRMAAATALFAWAPGQVLADNLPRIALWWDLLDQRSCAELRAAVSNIRIYTGSRVKRAETNLKLVDIKDMSAIPATLRTFLGPRLPIADQRELLWSLISDQPSGRDPFVDGEVAFGVLGTAVRKPTTELIGEIRNRFVASQFVGGNLSDYQNGITASSRIMERFPATIADMIISDPLRFPWRLVEFTNRALVARSASHVVPLRVTANEAGWFKHDADRDLQV